MNISISLKIELGNAGSLDPTRPNQTPITYFSGQAHMEHICNLKSGTANRTTPNRTCDLVLVRLAGLNTRNTRNTKKQKKYKEHCRLDDFRCVTVRSSFVCFVSPLYSCVFWLISSSFLAQLFLFPKRPPLSATQDSFANHPQFSPSNPNYSWKSCVNRQQIPSLPTRQASWDGASWGESLKKKNVSYFSRVYSSPFEFQSLARAEIQVIYSQVGGRCHDCC